MSLKTPQKLVPMLPLIMAGGILSPRSPASSRRPSSSSSASASFSSEDSELDPAHVQWLLPPRQKSRLHLRSKRVLPADGLVATCRTTPFKWGAEEGTGMDAAARTGRRWCKVCQRALLRRLGHLDDAEVEL